MRYLDLDVIVIQTRFTTNKRIPCLMSLADAEIGGCHMQTLVLSTWLGFSCGGSRPMITSQRVEGSFLVDYAKLLASCLLPSHPSVKFLRVFLHNQRKHVSPVCVTHSRIGRWVGNRKNTYSCTLKL